MQYNIKPLFALGSLCFYSKVCSNNKKSKKKVTPSSLNQHVFLLIQETRRSVTKF